MMMVGAISEMRVIQSDAAISPELQDAIDEWLEVYSMKPILNAWVNAAPPLTKARTVFRLESGNRGSKALRELRVGSIWELGRSTASTLNALLTGVIEPNEPPADEGSIFYVELAAGRSWGRDIVHSEGDHPTNIPREFLLRAGVKVRVTRITEFEVDYMDDMLKVFHGEAFL
jgi:hypothetical protein